MTATPGPKGSFLLGNLREVSQDMLGFFTRSARRGRGLARTGAGLDISVYYVSILDPLFMRLRRAATLTVPRNQDRMRFMPSRQCFR
jgi:hypothetical protein